MSHHGNITVLILAGGGSRRMGGEDKAWLQLAGKPFIEHVLQRLRGQSEQFVISANRDIERYQQLKLPVFSDTPPLDRGPLAGIASVLPHIETHYLLCVPCDTPMLPLSLVDDMTNCLQQQACDVVVADDGERMQQAILLLQRDRLTSINDYLNGGGRSLKGWLEQQKVSRCRSGSPENYINLNTPQQLRQLEQRLTQ